MKLQINNFSKIGKAEIIVDGITVIAGENNTGKSTIGKILFCLFNSISSIEDKIAIQRINEIQTSCRRLLQNYPMNLTRELALKKTHSFTRKVASNFKIQMINSPKIDNDDIRRIIIRQMKSQDFEKNELNDLVDPLVEKISSILVLSEEHITLELLTRYFNNIFHYQLNSLIESDLKAELQLIIKNKKINVTFSDSICTDFSSEIAIMHHAIYIDNPFVIDSLSYFNDLNTMDDYLRNLLTSTTKENVMEGIIESVLVKEKLNEVYQAIQHIVDGQITEKKDEYFLEREDFLKPIYFNNLSTGIKSFIIIKMLLEKGSIREKDVLVLDEPEIHLHPQWQIAYAELIVLLQKHFDLSIVVATHSPYFLDAINLYSIKHGIEKKVNYYLSSMESNRVKMEQVTDNIDLIYKKLASPIEILDSLRYELNNN